MFFNSRQKPEFSDEEKLNQLQDKFELARNQSRGLGIITTVIAVVMSLYQLWSAGVSMLPQPQHKAIHLAFGLLLTFLVFPASRKDKGKFPWYDALFALFSIAGGAYLVFFYWDLVYRAGSPIPLDIAMGIITLVLVFEASRRTMGWPLVIVGLLALSYALFGKYLPGSWGHRGYSIERIVEHLFLTGEGIYGVAIYVSASFVFIFILLGSFLGVTGGAQSFIDLAFSLTGKSRGGPAKAAVVASGFMGMISGSSFANVAGTGTFTIPLMKSVGYKREFAGGVEAAASAGGQIMPPIMGAAAFIMAEMTGIPYGRLILHAAIPAILYYVAVYIMVDLEAAKMGLAGIPKEKLPKFLTTMKNGAFLLFAPFSIVFMLLLGFTPIKASFYAVAVVIVVSMFKKETRLNSSRFVEALDKGARGALSIISACAVAGVIVGIVTLTGLGLKFADLIITLSGGMLFPALLLTMVACIFMGMGMPTTALYIILGAMVAPVLVKLGVPVVAAHLFIFYFGCFAAVTPPVALSSYLAATIAKADPTKTALVGLKLASTAFLMPFIFAYSPALILLDTAILETLVVVVTAVVGVYALSCSLQGFLLRPIGMPVRMVLLIAAIASIIPGWMTDVGGMSTILIVVLVHIMYKPKAQTI